MIKCERRGQTFYVCSALHACQCPNRTRPCPFLACCERCRGLGDVVDVEPLRKSGDSEEKTLCIFEAGNNYISSHFLSLSLSLLAPSPPIRLLASALAPLHALYSCTNPSESFHCRRLKFCARRFTVQPCQRAAAAAATAWWVWYGRGQSTLLLSQQHSFSDLSRLIPTSRRWQHVVAPWRCHSTRPSQTCP